MMLAKERSRTLADMGPPPLDARDLGRRHRGARTSDRTWLGGVLVLVGIGLVIQAIGEHLGRTGDNGRGQICLVAGIALIYLPCAWRLIESSTSERERTRVVVVLGLALVISAHLVNPLVFTGFDELLHQTTLWQIQYHHAIFTTNTELPVSPYYPGLELVTVGIRDATGAPTVVAEMIVVGLARLILILSLFRIVQRMTHSVRAAGIAVLVYAASPQFYGFNAAFSYQTLALAFAAGAACLLIAALDAPAPRVDRRVLIAELAIAGMIITHHLVSFITVAVVIAASVLARQRASRARARILAHAAIVSVVLITIWTSITARRLVPYLRPILVGAATGFVHLLQRHRSVLRSSNGIHSPAWQSGFVLISVAIVFVAIVAATVIVLRRPAGRRGRLRYLLPLIALAYPLDLATALSPDASEAGQRASTFLFIAIAVLVAAAVPGRLSRRRTGLAAAVATAAFIGSVVLGAGPLWDAVPGPFVPAADQRGIDNASLSAGTWAAAHLPIGATIAADRDNGVVMSAIGHLAPVTAFSGGVNVGPIYFDPVFGRYDQTLIRRAQIRYLLVDTRLATGAPAFGSYFEPGETQGRERLTAASLDKFVHAPGLRRVYDNGPITIYDLGAILGVPTTVPTSHSAVPPVPTNPGIIVVVGAVALVWARRWRWRTSDLEAGESTVAWLLVATVAIAVVGLIVVAAGVAPSVVEVALFLVAAVGVADAMARSSGDVDRPRASRTTVTLGLVGAIAVVVAMTVSAVSARSEWQPTPSLSAIEQPNGRTVAAATLDASAPPDTSVALAGPAGVVWQTPVPLPDGMSVILPLAAFPNATSVELLVGGRAIRSVAR
jgi:hypothetical protein